jgi:hypothetical protein
MVVIDRTLIEQYHAPGPRIPRDERDGVRQDLLDYCERDTWAMVKLLERLRELAGAA